MLRLIKKIQGLFSKKKIESVNDTNFRTLSPTKKANIDKYEEVLNFVFSNNEIKNVAITGAYCSGKSSIIETYGKNNKDIKLLHISLAHFCAVNKTELEKLSKKDSNDEKTTTDKIRAKEKKRSTIESKLINQLIYQIPENKIKYTKFRIKRKPSLRKPILLSIISCVLIALLVYIYKFYSWKVFYENIQSDALKHCLHFTTIPEMRIISAIIILTIIGFIVFKLVYAQYANSFIRKISFQGNEIEIANESKSSFFDKYLNDVLCIFDEVNADAVVFDDIDRFDDITLFERLREINTLVNIRRKRKKKNAEPLRFIYLMRDDIFMDFKDRTKFFDFIIPVVPILDGSNSYSKLKGYLAEDGLVNYIDDHFLREISLYIDDFRVLKNINNELLIYYDRLDAHRLDLNRLLAMLVYKNIFPHDYDELRFNRGCVYSFFAAEERIKNGLKAPYKERENIIKKEIKEKDIDYRASLEEIDKNRLNSEQNDKSGTIQIMNVQPRKIDLRMEHDKAVKPLHDELIEIQKEQTEIDNIPLNELLSSNSESIFNDNYMKNTIKVPEEIIKDKYFGLLKFLLTSGYIDASYADYMTYYYENGLSINDNNFIRAVLERNNQEYSYKINNPNLVIESIKPNYFSQPATLNFDLYDYIFSSSVEYPKQISNAMSFFGSSRRVDHIKFIEEYLLSKRNTEIFFEYLLKTWKDIFDYVEDKISDEALRELSLLILKYSSDETLNYYRENKSGISVCLSSMPNVFSLEISRERLYWALDLLDVRFVDLGNELIDTEALGYLYTHDLYELNEINIRFLLKSKCNVEDINNTLKSFFTFVYIHNDYPLCLYVGDNIEDVISVYLDMYHGEIEDDSDTVCKVISNIENDSAEKYINQLTTKIGNITEILNPDVLPLLIEHGLVELNADNIISWYEHDGKITPSLMSFIQSDDSIIKYDLEDGKTKEFLSELLKSEELSDKKFLQIIQSFGNNVIDAIKSLRIPEKRVRVLIDLHIIECSKKSKDCIRMCYPNLLEPFICGNIENYFSARLSQQAKDDFSLALASNMISVEKKIELLQKCSSTISLIDKAYLEPVTLYILEHNFNSSDLEWLARNYSSFSDSVKKKVSSLIISSPSEIIKINNDINFELKKIILSAQEIVFSQRVRFLSMYLDEIEKEDLGELLLALGANKIAENIIGANNKLIVDQKNRSILRVLWKKHIIMHPQKTPTGKQYQKLQFITKTKRPHITTRKSIIYRS